MATRSQIGRLAQRIDAIATRMAPPPPPMAMEWWIVERDRAWERDNPEVVISAAELAARPTTGSRIVATIMHAKHGRPDDCCQPGGSCRLAQEVL